VLRAGDHRRRQQGQAHGRRAGDREAAKVHERDTCETTERVRRAETRDHRRRADPAGCVVSNTNRESVVGDRSRVARCWPRRLLVGAHEGRSPY
jgi:hypothetical protein